MIMKKPPLCLLVIAGIASTLFCAVQIGQNPVQAQNSQAQNVATSKPLAFNASPEDFAGRRRPRHRTSGGSRGPCSNQLIALVPGSETVESHEGICTTRSISWLTLTIADSPTFWFYIPQSSNSETPAEFALLDQNHQPIFTEQITLPATSGIISLPLTQPLEMNQSYQWVFSILANPRNPSQNPKVEGLVKRVEPGARLSNQLQQATSQQEKIAIYANHGIWHDALTALAEQHFITLDSPTLMNDWSDFLKSVGLGEIAHVPLLDCCIPVTNP